MIPQKPVTNNIEEIDNLLHAIRKAIDQRDCSELLRLKFICHDLYGMNINEDGSLTPLGNE